MNELIQRHQKISPNLANIAKLSVSKRSQQICLRVGGWLYLNHPRETNGHILYQKLQKAILSSQT